MSRLSAYGRPWVTFDPGSKDHRKWFAQFEKTGTWGRCPVRFIANDEHGDLLLIIRASLVDYYVKREFKE
jgi:hypothetical protein